jgi:uncharacterized protein (TIGR02466 family)
MSGRILRLFPTPVIIDELPGAPQLNRDLEPAILGQMNRDEGVHLSNRGGWQSGRDFPGWAGEAGHRLVRHAVGVAASHTVRAPNVAPVGWTVDAWANVSGSGHFNMPHIHGGSFWSAVYYVSVGEGEGGQLVLHDPRMPALRMHSPGLRFKGAGPEYSARIEPKAGLLLLFPAWLSHSVEVWRGSGTRISVAMNIRAAAEPGPAVDESAARRPRRKLRK